MPPKGKQPAKGGKADDDDDDWEALLEAEAAANGAKAAAAKAAEDAAAAAAVKAKMEEEEEEDDEDDEGGAGGAKGKDKKKKKKKGKAAGAKEEAPASAGPMTAAGKAILLRQQQLAAEEARIKALQEEEERRIKEEEEKEEAERRAVEEDKERKRKAKQDKVDAQKAAGTYMTKAEKEKARIKQMKLDAMKAAGLLPGAIVGAGDGESKGAAAPAVGGAMLYANKKKKPTPGAGAKSQEELEAEAKAAEASAAAAAAKEEEEDDDGDDWDADGDDWEANLDKINIAAKVGTLVEASAEDQLEVDNKKEQERLKVLGIERAKREEEARIKREEEERERAEMEQREREAAMRKENSRKRRVERDAAAKAARSPDKLRSPISCIMGHVDTGKTKLLDKIRHTNVQEGEAGGITQQIGATQFSRETLMLQTKVMQKSQPFDIRLPGLLVIDTPGHESFTNLRNRGSSLCDIAILVIDLMHGLEQQTIESIQMLRSKNAPFVVALNKVDRCYGWKTLPDGPIRDALAQQDENVIREFNDRTERITVQLNELGLNAKLYWENDSLDDTVSLVPTSAVSGEGVPDLLMMLITLTQERQTERLMYVESVQCTVLEVKVVEGLGHTVDVVLVNGTLKEGDTIVVSTMEGPVVTSIRALLTPPPNREMRVKSEYIHHETLSGAIGIKIVAPEIGRAIAGTSLLVVQAEDDVEDVKDDVQSDLSKVMKALATDSKGVMVHASTLGALEALLQFLREECKPAIPVSHINIGPIYKKDVMRANIMNEKNLPEFATILAFDVKVDSEAQSFADENKVRIFTAEIIYHLFDQFSNFMNGLNESRRAEAMTIATFPAVVKILPQHIFNKKDPIVFGVEVLEGTLKVGTMLCVPALTLDVGRVTSIENNHREVPSAKKGTSVSIKISNESNPQMTYGRQFDHTHTLYSKLTRQSIDALKQYFKDDVSKEDWGLVVKLKKVFNIP